MWETDLLQISGVGAQNLNISGLDTGAEKQVVKRIVFAVLVPDTGEQFAEKNRHLVDIHIADIFAIAQGKVMNPVKAVAELDSIGTTDEYIQTHRFQNRHRLR